MIINQLNEKVMMLKDVKMRFGTQQVLNGINLDVYKGQIIGYIGPNGAGKSTTIKLMLGLLDGYEGYIEIFGEDISNGDPAYKQRIGYVPESADIYDNLTACEYLAFIGELYGLKRTLAEEKAYQLLEQFDMGDVFHQRISSFSKGMRQKVLIVSSLLHNPDIIFLDEPLSGLDANSVMIIKEMMEQLKKQGKTIVYSSHIMDVVEKISNRIVLIVDGKIAADGSFEELKEQSKEGTLETIFNQITGFGTHREIAEEIVRIVGEEERETHEW